MTSIRQQVFDYLKKHPDISLKETKVEFKDCPKNTIREYYRQFKAMANNMSIDVKSELIKIIKDYKQPASSRVQAIRELNAILNNQEINNESEDPYLKYLRMSEKLKSETKDIDDSSLTLYNSPTQENRGNTSTKT